MKQILSLLIMMTLLCGCTSVSDAPTETTSALQATVETSSPPPTAQPTEFPEDTLHGGDIIPYLNLDAGAYLRSFDDPETAYYLDYYLHVPENATENMPLLVFLHGDGEVGNPDALEYYEPIQIVQKIYDDEFPFIALFPCTRVFSWVDGSIPETLIHLIEELQEELKLDETKIMLAGHSRGAIGVWNMIGFYGDFFSCAVPISCGTGGNINLENAAKVPVWAIVGNVGEYELIYAKEMRKTVEKLREMGGIAYFQVYEDKTHIQTVQAALNTELFEWMLSWEVKKDELL